MKRSLAVAAIAAALTLAGCTASPAGPPTPAPTAVPATTSPEARPELPLGVLATGTFEGGARGEVEVINAGDGMFTLHIDGFGIDFERYSGVEALSYRSYPDDSCDSGDVRWAFGYEQTSVVPETYLAVVPLDGFSGDPSLIRELIIRDFDAPESSDECAAAPAAKAVLTWTHEPLRASLAADDQGVTGGAHGETTSVDGVVITYTVARNDLIDEVAARFGMTSDDIRYLNPLLGPKLRTGDTILLNGASR